MIQPRTILSIYLFLLPKNFSGTIGRNKYAISTNSAKNGKTALGELGVSNGKWWPRQKGGSVAGVARASADQYFILASPTS